MRHFPIFLDLAGRIALVLGAGEVADRKADALRRAGAEIRFAARFDRSDLSGIALAVGADAPEADLHALASACQAAGIPVNVVDRPELCAFIMPAIVDRAPITIAISSAGTAPVLARLLRARIDAAIPSAFGRLAALADSFKAELRGKLPDLAQRRRLLERLLTGRVAELVFTGQDAAARAAFAAALDGYESSLGSVHFVDAGPGAADLMTLRGQRLLGEADVVVHDATVSDAVLDLARRDAERRIARPDLAAMLLALAVAGRKVIRLSRMPPHEAEALAAAGILVEMVPGIAACGYCATQPPSMDSDVPVIVSAASEHRNTATPPT